jgi:hypothetical protein
MYADFYDKYGNPMWETQANRRVAESMARLNQENAYEFAMTTSEMRWPPRTWSQFFLEMSSTKATKGTTKRRKSTRKSTRK